MDFGGVSDGMDSSSDIGYDSDSDVSDESVDMDVQSDSIDTFTEMDDTDVYSNELFDDSTGEFEEFQIPSMDTAIDTDSTTSSDFIPLDDGDVIYVEHDDVISPDVNPAESLKDDIGEVIQISDINNVGDWLDDINPNYDPFDTTSPYSTNCGSCAYAVHQRLDGDDSACASAENISLNSDMEALTGMEQVPMLPIEIESRLLEEGDGAHAIIGIDRAEGPGHWFNAANIDGKVVAIDGQTGTISDWPPDYGDVVNWEMSVKK